MAWRLQVQVLRNIRGISTRAPTTSSFAHLSSASAPSDGFRGRQSKRLAAVTKTRPEEGNRYSAHNKANFKTSREPNYVHNEDIVKIKKCLSIEQTIQAASSCLDSLSPRDIEAVWKHLLTLAKRNRQSMNHSQTDQLGALFHHSTKAIESCHHADLSFIVFTLAQIVKFNREWNSLLLDSYFWGKVQERFINVVGDLSSQAIVSIAWSLATISHPMYLARKPMNVIAVYEAILPAFIQKKRFFTSNNIANLAWSCVTCGVTCPALFDAMAAEFVWRRKQEDAGQRDLEDLNAITICQLANAFAKSGNKDATLFQSISDCAIPMISSFDSRNFANLAHSFATAGMNPKCIDGVTLFDEIEHECVRKLGSADSQNMANLVWAYATLEYEPDFLFQAVANEARGRLGQFQPKHLCNIAWGFSKYPPSKEIFDDIAREVVSRGFGTFTSQGLAILANSFATVGYKESDFWEGVERAVVEKSPKFAGIECARIAWSFATVERPAPDAFNAIAKVSVEKTGEFNAQGLSNIAWAFSLMGHGSQEFFNAISERCVCEMDEFKPQEMTMLLLAYSRLKDNPHPVLYDKVIAQSIGQLDKFPLLDLYNMAISYAKVDHTHEKWMLAIADEVIRRDSQDHPIMHTGMLWAYATARISHPRLVQFLTNSLQNNLTGLHGDNMASIAWSLASLGSRNKLLFDALAEASDREEIRRMNTQSLANMAWAYATVRDATPRLFNDIAEEAVARDDFTPQGISNILWAFATVARFDQELFSHLAILARVSLDEFSGQALSNLAWAYTVSDIDATSLFEDEAFVNKCLNIDDFDDEGLPQLHQWNIWRKNINSTHVLPDSFAELCHTKYASLPLRQSSLQKDIVSELRSMGFNPNEEVELQSTCVVDATIEMNGKCIAIEVEGPSHFVGKELDGSTRLKHRQVTTIDKISLVYVPYWEWNELKNSEEKHKYLKSKLKNA
ncbi:hypothetical protein ACHAXN_009263 [Cyclotella atomus]